MTLLVPTLHWDLNAPGRERKRQGKVPFTNFVGLARVVVVVLVVGGAVVVVDDVGTVVVDEPGTVVLDVVDVVEVVEVVVVLRTLIWKVTGK